MVKDIPSPCPHTSQYAISRTNPFLLRVYLLYGWPPGEWYRHHCGILGRFVPIRSKSNVTELSANSFFFNDVFTTLLNIYDGAFYGNRSRLKIFSYFQIKISIIDVWQGLRCASPLCSKISNNYFWLILPKNCFSKKIPIVALQTIKLFTKAHSLTQVLCKEISLIKVAKFTKENTSLLWISQ